MEIKICKLLAPLILVLTLLASLTFSAYPQSKKELVDQLVLPLYKSAQTTARDQIYIQLSKGSYEAGEDLWFKAYVLNVLSFMPSSLSKTVYVKVTREDGGKPVWQERYEAVNGTADGQVYLSDTLKEGNYLLEAFTMASFYKEGPEFKALRRFRVVQDYKSLQAQGPEVAKVSQNTGRPIQFGIFPEGGKLVSGVPGSLAFKAVGTDGLPVEVSGTLMEDGKALREFKSVHAGMGSLVFTPVAGRKYTLQLKAPIDSTVQLPETNMDGLSFRLNARDTDSLEFTITRPPGFSDTRVYLRGQIRGNTCFLTSELLKNELKIIVPLQNFAYQGVAEFTVFDAGFMPLAERLVYVNPQKKLYIKTELSKPGYEQREKAVLHIKTYDEGGKPVSAELAISVYDKLYATANDPNNLLAYNMLSTQLKGRIYDPAFYFDDKNEGREEAMDLLLLTQGWRNYVWNEENLKTEGLKHAVVFDGTLGTVSFTKRSKQTPPGQLVNSFMSDDRGMPKNQTMIIPGQGGRFLVSTAILKMGQGANIYLKPQGPDAFQPRIKLENPFLRIDTIMKLKKYTFPYQGIIEKPAPVSILPTAMDARVSRLKEVTINAAGTRSFRDKYLGHLDSLLKIDPNGAFVCKHGLLNGYWPGYYCVSKGGRCTDTLTTSPIEGKRYEITRYEYVNTWWDLKDVQKVIYQNPNAGLSEEEILAKYNISKITGYYPKKEFYQPDYDKESSGDGLPDARNTLLWAPAVQTDEKGEAQLTFFCSDINSGFMVQAEGLTKGGLLGTQQLDFKVIKGKVSAAGR